MHRWKMIGFLIAVVVIVCVGLTVDRLVWFGPDIQPRDYALELRRLQVATTGASAEDFRAHEHLAGMMRKFEAIEANGLREPTMKFLHAMSEGDRATTAAWVEALEQAGLFDDFHMLCDFSAYVYPWDGIQLFGSDYSSGLAAIRKVVRAGRFRSEFSMDSGNTEPAMDAIRAQVAAAAILLPQPVAIFRLTGFAVLAGSMNLTREAIHHGLSSGQIDELAAIYDAVEIAPLQALMDGEQLLAEEAIASAFQGNRTVRIMSRGALASRLDEEFKRASAWAGLSANERRANPYLESQFKWDDAPVGVVLPAFEKLVQANDQIACHIAGTRAVLAIERYRQATGSLPDSPRSLVPEFMAELPPDPYNELAAAFGYRLVEVSAETPDGYVLYTVGYDGTDDGGTPALGKPHAAFVPGSPGTDFVLNRRDLD